MTAADRESAAARLDRLAREWRVDIETRHDTRSSLIAFGTAGSTRVCCKVVRTRGDEWRCGTVLRAFAGPRYVRVLEYEDGAVLMERLTPATPLSDLVDRGRDDEAIDVLADIAAHAPAADAVPAMPSVADWGESFDRYLASGDSRIDEFLVRHAQAVYRELCETQTHPRLLHGDLQHENVLFDESRGWVAIDPKGVVGELAFEVGPLLRNPATHVALISDARAVEHRIQRFASRLQLDADRVLRWAFAQATLSAIWSQEDGEAVVPTMPSLRLAAAARSLIPLA